MKTIQEIVDAKVAEMISGGTIEETIKNSIEQSITKALESQFESYGGITKQIETAIKEGLQINVKDLPFESYNAQMLVAIKQRLGNMFHGQAYEHFLSQIDDLLEPAPKELPINDFLEKIASMWKTDDPYDADDLDESMTVEIEEWRNGGDKGDWGVKLWKQEDSRAGFELFILKNKLRISHRNTFNPTCFDEAEAYIFKLYAAGTVITGIADCDPDDLDLCLKDDEY